MKSLLKDTFGYNGRLKRFIKAPSYGQILFHKKNKIKEAIVERDVNSLKATAMTTLRIPNSKPKIIAKTGKIDIDIYSTFIIEVERE
jgi:hypothetical protein